MSWCFAAWFPMHVLGLGILQWSWWPYQHWIQDWIVYLSICKNNQYIHFDDVLINLQEHQKKYRLPTSSNSLQPATSTKIGFSNSLPTCRPCSLARSQTRMRPGIHGPWVDRFFPHIFPQPRRLTFTTCSACGTNLPWLGEKKLIPGDENGRRKNWLWPMGFCFNSQIDLETMSFDMFW